MIELKAAVKRIHTTVTDHDNISKREEEEKFQKEKLQVKRDTMLSR